MSVSSPDFSEHFAASFRRKGEYLRPIIHLDLVDKNELLFLDEKFAILRKNFEAFLSGAPYHHCLLAGAKGCGKSSLIKAIFSEFQGSDLRVIELFKQDLDYLRYIIDELECQEYKFAIFLDDLSFDLDDESFKQLKPIMDGGIAKLSPNIIFVVSSNYKNLLKTKHNQDADFSDEMDDRFALKERFGIWLSFYSMSQNDYLDIICKKLKITNSHENWEQIRKNALAFASSKGSRSGRIAEQFAKEFSQI